MRNVKTIKVSFDKISAYDLINLIEDEVKKIKKNFRSYSIVEVGENYAIINIWG